MLTELLRLYAYRSVSTKFKIPSIRNAMITDQSINQSVSQSLKCLSCRATSETLLIGGQRDNSSDDASVYDRMKRQVFRC